MRPGLRTVLFSAKPDLLVNGHFNDGSTGWAVTNADGTHIVTFAAGTMRYQSDTTSPVLNVEQNPGLTAGKFYAVEVWCSAYTSGSLKVDNGLGATVIASGLGYKRSVIQTLAATFTITRNSANVDLILDRVKVSAL